MKDKENKKLVPELRFQDFSGEWDEDMIGNRGIFTGGGTPRKNNASFWEGEIPWVSSSDISEDSIHTIDVTRFISEEALKKSATKKIPAHSLLIVSRVGVGKLAMSTGEICTSQDFTNFTPTKDDLAFLGYYLKAKSKILLGFSQGMAIKGFTKDDIFKLELPFPIYQEQQKIAHTLTTLDELIVDEQEKRDALAAHKKGLLQQLFPAQGKKVPKLRFSEFEGEWEEDMIGKRGHFTGGGTPRKSKASFWEGEIPWVSSSDISEDSIHTIDVTRFISEEALKKSATKNVPANSLLIVSRVGVGKLAISTKEICTSQDFTNFTPTKDDLVFLGYYLKANSDILIGFSQGMAIKGFTKDDIFKLKLSFPNNIKEQQKIAHCLSSLNEWIAAQSEKIDALKEHKKGLMQGLFP